MKKLFRFLWVCMLIFFVACSGNNGSDKNLKAVMTKESEGLVKEQAEWEDEHSEMLKSFNTLDAEYKKIVPNPDTTYKELAQYHTLLLQDLEGMIKNLDLLLEDHSSANSRHTNGEINDEEFKKIHNNLKEEHEKLEKKHNEVKERHAKYIAQQKEMISKANPS